jgi:uncharacterized protein (TIGR03382 family)
LLLLLLSLQVASARSEWLVEVPNSSEQSCNTCHTRGGGTPRNPFGEDFGSNSDWAKLCAKDSDGDGATNGVELGDPDCAWQVGDADPDGYLSEPGNPDDFPPAADTDVADTDVTDTTTGETDDLQPADTTDAKANAAGCGCDSSGSAAAPFGLLGLLLSRRRRAVARTASPT